MVNRIVTFLLPTGIEPRADSRNAPIVEWRESWRRCPFASATRQRAST